MIKHTDYRKNEKREVREGRKTTQSKPNVSITSTIQLFRKHCPQSPEQTVAAETRLCDFKYLGVCLESTR